MDDMMKLLNTNLMINKEELPPVAQIEKLNDKNLFLEKEKELKTERFKKKCDQLREIEKFNELFKIQMDYNIKMEKMNNLID